MIDSKKAGRPKVSLRSDASRPFYKEPGEKTFGYQRVGPRTPIDRMDNSGAYEMARAQVSMPDILFATILFFLLLAGLYSYSQNLQSSAESGLERRNIDSVASNVAEFIIKNPGTPSNWETIGDINAISQIGLAQKDRVLRPEKVVAFVNYANTQYTQTKVLLSIPQYEFYIQFSGGATLAAGQAPSSGGTASVVQRLVTINGIETTFKLTVYEN